MLWSLIVECVYCLPCLQVGLHFFNSLWYGLWLFGLDECVFKLMIVLHIELLYPDEVIGREKVDAVHLLLDGWSFNIRRRRADLQIVWMKSLSNKDKLKHTFPGQGENPFIFAQTGSPILNLWAVMVESFWNLSLTLSILKFQHSWWRQYILNDYSYILILLAF